jgi:hypothetical protein
VIAIERLTVAGHRPQAPCQFVGDGHRGLVVPAPVGDLQRPGVEAVERASALVLGQRRDQHRACTVDQQRAQIRVAAFGDGAEQVAEQVARIRPQAASGKCGGEFS